jgi:hypothetical protein
MTGAEAEIYGISGFADFDCPGAKVEGNSKQVANEYVRIMNNTKRPAAGKVNEN